jgi:glutathione synthase/RimK-type ligase-like ATP-grasp enzyme
MIERIDVALASCTTLSKPDEDEAPALEALRAAGLTAASWAWDDPAVDFSAARLTVLRATWNYSVRPVDFLAWAERTAARSRLWNPLDVVRWNHHKSYLLDLEAAGVPVVQTALLRRGAPTTLRDVAAKRGWDVVVVKPAISAGSRGTRRFELDAAGEAGEKHLAALLSGGDALVQPFVPSVEGYGERATIWIDGELTHAVRKSPRFAGQQESVTGPFPVSDAEATVARRAVAVVKELKRLDLLYARVDMAPGLGGEPRVMELELIEPSLFFPKSRRALERFVAAVAARLR